MTNNKNFLTLNSFFKEDDCKSIIDKLRTAKVSKKHILETKSCSILNCDYLENKLIFSLDPLIEKIEEYFNIKVDAISAFKFETYKEGYIPEKILKSDNSIYSNGKWVRYNDYDFSIIIALTEQNKSAKLKKEYDSYGGSILFPNHSIDIDMRRGDVIVFPSEPNFINYVNEIKLGNRIQIRIHIKKQ